MNRLHENFKKGIIRRMASHGYFYDELESHTGRIKFDYNGQTFPMSFRTWGEADEWERNVDWDD